MVVANKIKEFKVNTERISELTATTANLERFIAKTKLIVNVDEVIFGHDYVVSKGEVVVISQVYEDYIVLFYGSQGKKVSVCELELLFKGIDE